MYHRNTCNIYTSIARWVRATNYVIFISLLHVGCTIELWAIFLHVKHVQNCIDLLHFKYVQYFISIESCNCSWFIDKDSIYTYILHHLETSIWLGFYICTNRKLSLLLICTGFSNRARLRFKINISKYNPVQGLWILFKLIFTQYKSFGFSNTYIKLKIIWKMFTYLGTTCTFQVP